MRTLCGTILAAVLSLSANANSIVSFCERAKKGDRLTVAFLGGSLSWGANATDPNKASWRALVGRRLEERYPDVHFKFIDAAIGGTDSGLGIFRLERDVISYKPDIVFVEWLVNDGVRKADDDCSCSYEGIVRHILERLPGCVPVQVMLPTRGTIEEPDASKLVRWDEQKHTGAAYGLVRADVLGEMRRRHAAGAANLDRMWPAWPALLGDTTHPHDYGYSVYADIIWDQIFAKPSDKSPTMPDEWLFAPKYRHVVRENVAAWKDLPKGWHNDVCYVRAGTFDFLCSRWQDGLAVAANSVGEVPWRGADALRRVCGMESQMRGVCGREARCRARHRRFRADVRTDCLSCLEDRSQLRRQCGTHLGNTASLRRWRAAGIPTRLNLRRRAQRGMGE